MGKPEIIECIKRKAELRIWLSPFVIANALVLLLALILKKTTLLVAPPNELLFSFAGGVIYFAMLWVIMARYQKLKQVPVRTRTKILVLIILILWMLSVIFMIIKSVLAHHV